MPVYVVDVLYMHTMQTPRSSAQDEEVVQLPPDPGSGSVDLIDFSNPADLLLELVKQCGGLPPSPSLLRWEVIHRYSIKWPSLS